LWDYHLGDNVSATQEEGLNVGEGREDRIQVYFDKLGYDTYHSNISVRSLGAKNLGTLQKGSLFHSCAFNFSR
jgi:hypothetical protein